MSFPDVLISQLRLALKECDALKLKFDEELLRYDRDRNDDLHRQVLKDVESQIRRIYLPGEAKCFYCALFEGLAVFMSRQEATNLKRPRTSGPSLDSAAGPP